MIDILNSPVGVAFVGGILSIIGIAVAEFMRRQNKALKEVRADTAVAREQTANSHTTNLRDDIDRVLHGIDKLAARVDALGVDLAWERRERMDVASRLTRHELACASA